MSFFERFIRPALLEFGDRPALVHKGRVQTYAEMNRSFNRVGNALRALGLDIGDHSAILQHNSDRWVECEGGQAKFGIATVPLNTRLSPQEVAWHLNDSESRAVIFRPKQAALLESVRDQLTTCTHLLCIPEEDEAVPDWAVNFDDLLNAASDAEPDTVVPSETLYRLMYTSATTGMPKGVPITHSHFALHTATTLLNQLSGVSEEDRYLPVTPFTHMAIGFVWPFLARGGTVVCVEGWNPAEFLDMCAENEVTYSLLAPTIIIGLLRHIEDGFHHVHLPAHPLQEGCDDRHARIECASVASKPLHRVIVALRHELERRCQANQAYDGHQNDHSKKRIHVFLSFCYSELMWERFSVFQ